MMHLPSRLVASLLLPLLVAATGVSVSAQDAAPAATAATDEAPADLTLFGEQFLLTGELIDVDVEGNAVTELDARQNVVLEMDELVITSTRLIYSEESGLMRAYGDQWQRVVVQQAGALTFCDEFVYNTKTKATTFIGRPDLQLADSEKQDVKLAGDVAYLRQSEGAGTKLVMARNRIVRRDFEAPGTTSLTNPLATNPRIEMIPLQPRDRTVATGQIPEDILTARPAPFVVPIGRETVGFVSDKAYETKLYDIKAEEAFGLKKKKDEKGGGLLSR